ncbi:hypothetical protein SLEP1_g30643 [Rubroshorea leprosula]|uniref:HTH myb-type domain-containing protein n=1 Tax=Rubroshorea leprosula TaxID=152421 RepID=A0AAV5K6C3_9ROSI|nr:hypothetical protein SLEP1_g30643 [Rubroshorea leprosula]
MLSQMSYLGSSNGNSAFLQPQTSQDWIRTCSYDVHNSFYYHQNDDHRKSSSLTLEEKKQLKYLEDQLGICIKDEQHEGASHVHKQRIRWTPELHELFLNAVEKLGGAESATPKNILRLMNVEGLHVYHVKSHLQKYRLAKNASEMKQDKRSSKSEEMRLAAPTDSDNNVVNLERSMQVLEAMRMQIEMQKLLHEQLKIQRDLQVQIEQHGQYLKKIMEEQEKAGRELLSNPPKEADCSSSSRWQKRQRVDTN